MGFLERLDTVDAHAFIVGTHWGPAWVDQVFLFCSASWPSYLLLFGFIVWAFVKLSMVDGLRIGALLIASVALADLASVYLFKEVFQRLRPCYDTLLMDRFILVAKHCGGSFGFVSSHAATIWAGWAVIRASKAPTGFLGVFTAWAVLVSYSRVYVGVHYPGDVIGGALLGYLISWSLLRWRPSPTFEG